MAVIRVTISGTYEADPANYDVSTPADMAAVDQDEYESGGFGIRDVIEWLEVRGLAVKFESEGV